MARAGFHQFQTRPGSLGRRSQWLIAQVGWLQAPWAWDDAAAKDFSEDEQFLRIYIRLVFSCVAEMLLFAFHYQNPPWSYCRVLLDDDAARKDSSPR